MFARLKSKVGDIYFRHLVLSNKYSIKEIYEKTKLFYEAPKKSEYYRAKDKDGVWRYYADRVY